MDFTTIDSPMAELFFDPARIQMAITEDCLDDGQGWFLAPPNSCIGLLKDMTYRPTAPALLRSRGLAEFDSTVKVLSLVEDLAHEMLWNIGNIGIPAATWIRFEPKRPFFSVNRIFGEELRLPICETRRLCVAHECQFFEHWQIKGDFDVGWDLLAPIKALPLSARDGSGNHRPMTRMEAESRIRHPDGEVITHREVYVCEADPNDEHDFRCIRQGKVPHSENLNANRHEHVTPHLCFCALYRCPNCTWRVSYVGVEMTENGELIRTRTSDMPWVNYVLGSPGFALLLYHARTKFRPTSP